MNKSLAALFLLILVALFTPAQAATGDPLDLQFRFGRYHETIVINEDGTASESLEWSKTILKESALERVKRASISYSTSAQKAEVVAAYTLKADGRRIDVPKDNYQVEVNSGKGKDAPVYSDWTTLTVVFPDVAVGDSVVFSYKVIQTEPMFPKHYSTTEIFFSQVAYDDVRVRIDYPASLWVQYETRGMKETENSSDGGRKVVEWRYENPKPLKFERRDFSVFDPGKEVGYAFSTFRNYGEIAAAYGARAIPKAAPTERIARLAADIVKDKKAPRDQARAIYDWVATNITYAGNCIGIGAVVPRDVSFILDNKMGDCKDHATLLQALLSARGIRSIQALVNAGSVYRLQKIPVVSTVNHVINYLPDFDLYADSTSDSTPFGILPHADQDKPVLLVENYRDGVRTPPSLIGSDRQQVKTLIKIAPDGSASGTIAVQQHGRGAVQSRAWARELTKDVEDDLVKNVFRAQGLIGSGKFEKDDPTELVDTYRYKLTLAAEKFLKLPGPGAFYIYPPIGLVTWIGNFVGTPSEIDQDVEVVCGNIHVDEDYLIELPKTVKVLSIPNDAKVANDFFTYSASYRLKGNQLTVKRSLDDRTKGNVCSPQVFAEYKKVADKVMDNLKEQVLYK